MFTTNFRAIEKGYADRYKTVSLLEDTFQREKEWGGLGVYRSIHKAHKIWAGRLSEPTVWMIYYNNGARMAVVNRGQSRNGELGLLLNAVSQSTFVLHSTDHFRVPRDGLFL